MCCSSKFAVHQYCCCCICHATRQSSIPGQYLACALLHIKISKRIVSIGTVVGEGNISCAECPSTVALVVRVATSLDPCDRYPMRTIPGDVLYFLTLLLVLLKPALYRRRIRVTVDTLDTCAGACLYRVEEIRLFILPTKHNIARSPRSRFSLDILRVI